MLIIKDRGLPLPLQAQSALRQVIEDHFEEGDTFWAESTLIQELGVSRATIRQALTELTRQGLLIRRAAKASIVNKKTASVIGVFFQRYNILILGKTQGTSIYATALAPALHTRGEPGIIPINKLILTLINQMQLFFANPLTYSYTIVII
jgi:DNA-binding transcriptional regulator YhcF (GntR family)